MRNMRNLCDYLTTLNSHGVRNLNTTDIRSLKALFTQHVQPSPQRKRFENRKRPVEETTVIIKKRIKVIKVEKCPIDEKAVQKKRIKVENKDGACQQNVRKNHSPVRLKESEVSAGTRKQISWP